MTDRELLELAAKAAGVPAYWSDDGTLQKRPILVIKAGGGQGTMPYEWPWNPLIDDGDNAQLRRVLRIVVQWFPTDVAAMHFGDDGRGRSWAEPYGKDPASAERLAVVRAAAEIGRSLK